MTFYLDAGRIAILEAIVSAPGDNRAAYYQQLTDWGSDYAVLAKSVVLNNTLSGQVANSYLVSAAANQGVILDSGDLLNLSNELVDADLAFRKAQVQNLGTVLADLTYENVRDVHIAAFDLTGVPIQAWTPYRIEQMYGSTVAQATLLNEDVPSLFIYLAAQASNAPATIPDFLQYSFDVLYNSAPNVLLENAIIPLAELSGDIVSSGSATLGQITNYFSDFATQHGLELAALLPNIPFSIEPGSAWAVYTPYLDLLNPFVKNSILQQNATQQGNPNWSAEFETAEVTRSPVVLDLNGDGVSTNSVVPTANGFAHFDFQGDGFAELTGWVGSGDALLVRDLNSNGTIDNGGELFGSDTLLGSGQKAANGFDALAELDGNADGKIDASDAAFSTLRLWVDDGDGVTEAGELKTLVEIGIVSINTNYTISTYIDAAGNEHRQTSSFTWTDNSTGSAADVWFVTNPLYAQQQNTAAIDPEIAALPEVRGYGTVVSLRQAMAADTTGSLQGLVEDFIGSDSPAERKDILEQIVFKWTGSEGIDPTSRGPNFDARRLNVLEQFMGSDYVGVWCWGAADPNPHSKGAAILSVSYQQIFNQTYDAIMRQSILAPLYSQMDFSQTSPAVWEADISDAVTAIYQEALVNVNNATNLAAELSRSLWLGDLAQYINFADLKAAFGDNYDWIIDTLEQNPFRTTTVGADYVEGTAGNDVISAGDGNDIVTGFAGNDIISGDSGADTLLGGEGNDTLYGNSGDDTLSGDDGNDILVGGIGYNKLNGGAGDDTYRFSASGSSDIFDDSGDADVIEVDPVFSDSQVYYEREGGDLIIHFEGTEDRIRVQAHFNEANQNRVESLAFSNGTTVDLTSDLPLQKRGTSGADLIYGSESGESIYGYNGADVIEAGQGNDVLNGGAGDDTLYGQAGDDTYVVSSGDIVSEWKNFINGSGNDTVEIWEGVVSDDVSFVRRGHDLAVTVMGGQQFFIQNQFREANTAVEQMRFADGSVLNLLTMEYVTEGTAGNDTITGISTGGSINDTILGLAGNDTIYGDLGNDTLDGGEGADTMYGGKGDDTYVAGDGDIIEELSYADGGTGEDTIKLRAGITAGDLSITRDGTNDVLIIAQGEQVRIRNQFGGSPGYVVEKVELADGTVIDLTQQQYVTNGTDGNDVLSGVTSVGGSPDDVLNGLGGDDQLYGADGNDQLNGGAGSDTLYGGYGNDTLDGGADADFLYGNWGNDTYVVGQGDTVSEWQGAITSFSDVDTIKLGSGITEANLGFIRQGDDLKIYVGETEFATVAGQYYYFREQFAGQSFYNTLAVEKVELADGTILNLAQIGSIINGTANADTLTGGAYNDKLYGLAGDDTLKGENGNDILDGGDGADTLYGGYGNDTYIAGAGDTVTEYLNGFGGDGNDTIQLAAGIAASDITFTRSGNNIVLNLAGGGAITINNQLNSGNGAANPFRIESIRLADGTVLDPSAQNYTTYGSELNDYLDGIDSGALSQNDVIHGLGGNDTIFGGAGNDQLYGDDGNDNINGGDGNDTLYGGAGNDIMDGGFGSNTLYGGAGDDTYRVLYGDTVSENTGGIGTGGFDTMEFNFYVDGVQLIRDGNDLIVDAYYGRTVRVAGHFLGLDSALDQIRLSNGTVINAAALVYNEITGTASSNNILGTDQNDHIRGLAGNDTLRGGAGNDLLEGGDGNDAMYGNDGNDTYVIGSGSDTLAERSASTQSAGGTDTIKLAPEFAPSDVTIERLGDTKLLIKLSNGGVNTVNSQFNSAAELQIENLVFANGTVVNLLTYDYVAKGTEGVDSLDGVLSGGGINDTLLALGGNDNVKGWSGNDIIDGGAGDDHVYGHDGNDTYIIGEGNDTVAERANTGEAAGGNDTLQLIPGFTSADVTFERRGNYNLAIKLSNGTTTIVQNQFNADEVYQIEKLKLSDGTIVNLLDGAYTTHGSDINETLRGVSTGGDHNDVIYAYGGNDAIYGGDGNDVLDGGAGDDDLFGNDGNDTYVLGAGNDMVMERQNTTQLAGGFDTLQLMPGITPADVTFQRLGKYDLLVKMSDGSVNTIRNQFNADEAFQIEQLRYADGSTVDLLTQSYTTLGTGVDEYMYGATSGGSPNDTLLGLGGNDNIRGYAGNDIIDGGTGNDALRGDEGDDLYLFSRGGQADTITNNDATSSNDTLQFGSDVAFDQLWLERVGNNLKVSIIGTEDTVTVANWYTGAGANYVDHIRSGDGHILEAAQVEQLRQAMSAYTAPASGELTMSAQLRSDLDTALAASWQNA